MTFREWWIQSSRKYDEQDAAYEAWNAALEEAAQFIESGYDATDCAWERVDWPTRVAEEVRLLKEKQP